MLQSIKHHNPCKDKVHIPVLKSSMVQSINNSQCQYKINKDSTERVYANMVGSVRDKQRGRQPMIMGISVVKNSCPQILKIRNCRSTANILNVENAGCDKMGGRKAQGSAKKKRAKKQWQHQNNENQVVVTKYTQKRSVKTILGCNQNIQKKAAQINEHTPQDTPQNIQKLLQQNNQLNTILSQKQQQALALQKQIHKIQQEYIRMLQVTNQCNESQIKILLREDQPQKEVTKNISNVNRSLRNSSISEKAQKLKAKLQKLDISSIKNSQLCANNNCSKENSFKLSETVVL